MEGDWAVEIGPGLPRIEADWEGFVDLRDLQRIDEISEAVVRAELREVLQLLNGPESPVFTSKCDIWELAAEEIDPFELDASPKTSHAGLACYIDVLARNPAVFGSLERHEGWVRNAALALRSAPGGNGRADWVVRTAVAGGREGFGTTLYAVGCGADTPAAETAWVILLREAVTVTMRMALEVRASSSIG